MLAPDFSMFWTCFKVHKQEGAKTDQFGGDSRCVAEGVKFWYNRSTSSSRGSGSQCHSAQAVGLVTRFVF